MGGAYLDDPKSEELPLRDENVLFLVLSEGSRPLIVPGVRVIARGDADEGRRSNGLECETRGPQGATDTEEAIS